MQDMSEINTMPARSSRESPDRSPKAVGKRLALLREIHNLDQDEIAESIGVTQGTYSNWETGSRPLGIQSAHAICDEYDVTLDWLYRGRMGSLPLPLENAIRRLKLGPKQD